MKRISFPIQSSAWITRGWTYQEAVLSRRCLFFTDEQVYFVCKQMTCCEAIHSLPNPKAATATEFAMLNTGMFDADLKDLSYERKGLWRFYEHLFQYKKRQLTLTLILSMHFAESSQSHHTRVSGVSQLR
jgi:hypothetical protein